MTDRPLHSTPPDDAREPDDLEAPPPGAGSAKLQRWIDLLAALLARRAPVAFDELARDIPAYAAKLAPREASGDPVAARRALDSLKRTFERDKQELRAVGVQIESVPDADGNPGGAYRLRRTDFYLPYLVLSAPAGDGRAPRRPARYGYQALATLAFEPDELQAVVDAAACVRELGDPLLAAEAERALRKLAVDLPIEPSATAATVPVRRPAASGHDRAVFEALGDALFRRKQVTFTYHAMGRDLVAPRTVEPWGLFFLHGHWYLAARDVAADALRNFRLGRISDVRVNAARALSADYDIPAAFRLRDHAASRQAWELGDSEAVDVVVAFGPEADTDVAARRLGRAVPDAPGTRVFAVRRLDPFVRWLLSFAGGATPISPAPVVAHFADALSRMAEAIDRPVAPGPTQPSRTARPVAPPEPGRPARPLHAPDGAAEQLRRILQLVPLIADGEEHDLDEVARRTGADRALLRHDIFSLVARYDTPGGFVEGVQLFVEGGRVSAVASQFHRPMRLVTSELCALALGLAVLHHLCPPDERAVLARARARLDGVIARLPGDPLPEAMHAASVAEGADVAILAALREGLQQQRTIRVSYRKAGAPEATPRDLCPYALVAAHGMLYLVAECRRAGALRVFRLDRIEAATVLPTPFQLPEGFSIDAVLDEGRAFLRAPHPALRVRYGPRIARWIAERHGVPPATDGSVTMDHPLADQEWALRHVLQYGGDAMVEEPAHVRDALRQRITAMRAALGAPG